MSRVRHNWPPATQKQILAAAAAAAKTASAEMTELRMKAVHEENSRQARWSYAANCYFLYSLCLMLTVQAKDAEGQKQ